MRISPTIHYNAGHIHKNSIQELMNLLHGNKFSPWEDFFVKTFSVLMSSVLTNYVSVHVCISVQVLVEAHAVEQ